MSKDELHVFRRQQIEDYRNSGQLAETWCEANAMKVSTLCYWLRRIKDADQPEPEHRRHVYTCRECAKHDDGIDLKISFIRAAMPNTLIPGSFTTPEFERYSVALSRQTMSNWLLSCAEDYYMNDRDRLRQDFTDEHFLIMTGSRILVLRNLEYAMQIIRSELLTDNKEWSRRPPRLYDLRHSFACNTLLNWLKENVRYHATDDILQFLDSFL